MAKWIGLAVAVALASALTVALGGGGGSAAVASENLFNGPLQRSGCTPNSLTRSSRQQSCAAGSKTRGTP
jgi:hypothetical protein